MFISRLSNVVETYDPYGIHRVNGVKAVYLLLVLFTVNLIYSVPDPYFYFFYAPLIAMAAEVFGETLEERFLLFFYCLVAATISVFIFNIFAPYWFFFIVVFFYSLLLYFLSINNRPHVVVIAPVALSLGAYSLLYGDINTSFYGILNHCLVIILATVVIFAALACFPRSYYYRLWLRSFILLIKQIIDHLSLLQDNKKIIFDPVQGHTTQLNRFANMLPRKFPIYSILRINLLINELHLIICVTDRNAMIPNTAQISELIRELQIFKTAVEQERTCQLSKSSLVILDKLIRSWNYLCLTC